MRRMALALALVLALPGFALAEVKSIEGASLGEHWYGPKYSMEDLQGRVVLIELWGYN